MAQYTAVLMHGERGGEGSYVFDAEENLMKRSPVKVIRAFMEFLQERHGQTLGDIEYEINGALNNKEKGVVTGIGNLVFHEADYQPFALFITAAQ